MTWRVAHISGLVGGTTATWQVRGISGTVGGGNAVWRVRSISGSTGSDGGTSGVTIAPILGQTVNSFDLVTITAATASGSAAVAGWSFTLMPDADLHSLPMTGTGATRTFRAPGRMNGCTVRIRINALLADGSTAASTVTTVTVSAHSDYIRQDGRWVAISPPRLVVPTGPPTALTYSTGSFRAAGTPVRLAGANAYWLGLNDNAGTSSGSYPSKATITAALEGARDMGVNLIRAHTIGISTGTALSFEPSAGTFVDANLDAADWAVAEAARLGIYLLVPLTDNWNYYHGGKWNFVHWAYQQNSSGLTDVAGTTKDDINERQFFANTTPGLRIRALFKAYISAWLNHVNPYTSLAYKNDPTIAIVETGNEIYYAAQLGTNEWTQDIASYVKSIAPTKLLMDGSGADRQAVSTQPGLTASAIDIVGAHYYPQQQSGSYPPVGFMASGAGYAAGTAIQQLTADATAASNAGKAFIVGEYPWTRSDISSFWTAVQGNANVDGDLFWSLIGGTEMHGSTFGSDDYPVHRPYLGTSEQTNAPALARHIAAVTGRSLRNGAG